MRRLTFAALAAVAVGCATMGTPPGGPPDEAAPVITRVVPDSGAVNVPDRALVVHFDEVVSDRPSGVTDLAGLVLISPRTGAPRVDWGRTSLGIRPRGGWLRGVTYTVTLLPGIGDVRGNTIKEPTRIVFSTGAEVATANVTGHLFDWVAARPVVAGIVEAIALPVQRDSIIYVGASDSSGAFTVGPLPDGAYLVRGFVDQNRNRARDRAEMWDSLLVTASADGTPLELLAAVRDTVGPRVTSVTQRDSLTIELAVDRPLRDGQPFGAERVRIVTGDSTPVPVASVALQTPASITAQRDSAIAAARDAAAARADSADTSAARPDTTPARARPIPRPALLDSVDLDDTVGAVRRPEPSRPSPPTIVVIRLAAPLAPGTAHRITVLGLESITGARRDSERVYSTPKPPPATQRAPSDTAPMPTLPARPPDPAPVRPDTGRPSSAPRR